MSVHIITGCMFSGKTSEIIKIINRLSKIDKKILIINSNLDDRYAINSIASHDKEMIECTSINNDKLLTVYEMEQYKESEYIIIDEAQFFKDLVDFVNYSTDILNKHLIVVGLNGDSDRKNFGEIKDIYPLADKITLLTALCLSCKDGTEAIFSKKITNKKEQIDVGNENTYIPVCRKCYNSILSTL